MTPPRPEVKTKLREEWLTHALDRHCRPYFHKLGYTIPSNVRVGTGWPSRGGLAIKKRVIGQAWSNNNSKDGTHEIIISVYLEDPVKVLGVLIHELIHVTIGVEHGHKKPFTKAMKALGLTGKATATTEGEELVGALKGWVQTLGLYPHASLDGLVIKKQGTRLLLMECTCGLKIRTTAKWLDEYGGEWPCPCGGKLVNHEFGDEDEDDDKD